MDQPIPLHARPMLFAMNTMLLDLIYMTQAYFKVDVESLLILYCVTDATMRPMMRGAETPEEVLANARPDNEERGFISRRMIADKTGLSRELVRRKARKLAKAGLIDIDDEGRVRSVQLLDEPRFQAGLDAAHQVILRYMRTIECYGVNPQTGRRTETA